jgi:hypothetical protein
MAWDLLVSIVGSFCEESLRIWYSGIPGIGKRASPDFQRKTTPSLEIFQDVGQTRFLGFSPCGMHGGSAPT